MKRVATERANLLALENLSAHEELLTPSPPGTLIEEHGMMAEAADTYHLTRQRLKPPAVVATVATRKKRELFTDDDIEMSPRLRLQVGVGNEPAWISRECTKGYALGDELGSGTSGTVYVATPSPPSRRWRDKRPKTHEAPPPEYAVKVQLLSPENVNYATERDLARRFSELGIAPVFVDAWECEGLGFIVTERWDGSMLDMLVKTLPPAMLYKLRVLIARLHEDGFVHGDIMPKNILVRLNDEGTAVVDVTLTDFGLTQSKEGWQEDPDFLNTMRDYYMNRNNPLTRAYFKKHGVTVEKMRADPAILDRAYVDALAEYTATAAPPPAILGTKRR